MNISIVNIVLIIPLILLIGFTNNVKTNCNVTNHDYTMELKTISNTENITKYTNYIDVSCEIIQLPKTDDSYYKKYNFSIVHITDEEFKIPVKEMTDITKYSSPPRNFLNFLIKGLFIGIVLFLLIFIPVKILNNAFSWIYKKYLGHLD